MRVEQFRVHRGSCLKSSQQRAFGRSFYKLPSAHHFLLANTVPCAYITFTHVVFMCGGIEINNMPIRDLLIKTLLHSVASGKDFPRTFHGNIQIQSQRNVKYDAHTAALPSRPPELYTFIRRRVISLFLCLTTSHSFIHINTYSLSFFHLSLLSLLLEGLTFHLSPWCSLWLPPPDQTRV